MTSELHRIIYTSRNSMTGSAAEQEASIRQILDAARRNNARSGITGALLFNGGCFAQVLEGSQAAIEQTFERIQRDLRHSDVVALDCRKVGARCFAAWSMAYVGRLSEQERRFGGIARESGFDPARLESDELLRAMEALVRDEEQAA